MQTPPETETTTQKLARRPYPFSRRTFLASAATAGACALARPVAASNVPPEERLDIGLVGCGGRGTWIADLFVKSGKYRLVACADYFQDRVDAFGKRFGVPAGRRFTGLSGYARLLDEKLDAVVIESPPYFHPEQAAAAVDAGKHVYLAKPIAVDIPGCTTIREAGRKATEKELVFLVDFQTRANDTFREAVKRVRAGAIGKPVLAEACYPWQGGGRGSPPAGQEAKLRSWYYVLPLSGDFIVEQSIHSLDVATWFIGAAPLGARGAGGRKVRPGDSIWDHFAVQYRFPDDLLLSFTCIQSIPGVKDEISSRLFGSDGVVYGDYFGDVWIRGKKPYPGGSTGNLYTDGTVTNIEEFHEAVTGGRHENPTVEDSVVSNMTAILGREAAYRGRELTLDALEKEGARLEFDTTGLKA